MDENNMEGIAYLDNRVDNFYDMLDDFGVDDEIDKYSDNSEREEAFPSETGINNRFIKLK